MPATSEQIAISARQREEEFRRGDILHNEYTRAYAEATGTPLQRRMFAWAAVGIKARTL